METCNQAFITEVEKRLSVKFINNLNDIFYFKSEELYDFKDIFIDMIKKEFGIDVKSSILLEHPLAYETLRFSYHGEDFISQMLFKTYGGVTIKNKIWHLYNDEKDQLALPEYEVDIENLTASEIQQKIAEWLL